jgi:hypothetical protein
MAAAILPEFPSLSSLRAAEPSFRTALAQREDLIMARALLRVGVAGGASFVAAGSDSANRVCSEPVHVGDLANSGALHSGPPILRSTLDGTEMRHGVAPPVEDAA